MNKIDCWTFCKPFFESEGVDTVCVNLEFGIITISSMVNGEIFKMDISPEAMIVHNKDYIKLGMEFLKKYISEKNKVINIF